MRKTVTYCSFFAFLILAVTLGGVVLLAVYFGDWQETLENEQVVEPVIETQPEDGEEPVETSIEGALSIFNDELEGFSSLEAMDGVLEGQFLYRVEVQGEIYYMAWGIGAIAVPAGVAEISTGRTEPGMDRAWASVAGEEQLILTSHAFLLR